MQSLLQNLSFSLRMLWKSPGLMFTVLLTLALGIGANTAIFTVDYATLIAPLPYPQPDQLVMVWSKIQGGRNAVSAGDFMDWRRESTAFQGLHAWSSAAFNLATHDQPEYVPGAYWTPGMASMMGNSFMLGRDLLPEEGQEGRDHVVVLSHRLWEKLGSDRDMIGKPLRLDGEPYTVVGVEAPGPADRDQSELAVPLVFKPEQLNHDFHWLRVMGRLKPGTTIKQAQADMEAITANLAKDYPKSNEGWGVAVEPLKDDFVTDDRKTTLWLLLGAVAFILLISCVNVANLLLAKSMTRQKEMAIRSAMGASPGSIFVQLLTESLLLAIMGGILGIGAGFGMLRGLIAVMPEGLLPIEADLRLNFPILLFTLFATTVAGLLFGSVPAWFASRVDPAETLKEGDRTGTGKVRHRLRRVLVVGEFALALALLAGAGLAIHSFMNLARVDLGVRTDHVLTFGLPLPDSRAKDAAPIIAYFRQILASIESVPGVTNATALTGMPLEGAGFGLPFTIAGQPAFNQTSKKPVAGFGMVTPEYFQTFGIPVTQGRAFDEHDDASGLKVAMVNEAFAKRFMKGVDPLQQRVVVAQLIPGVTKMGPAVDWQIVGVYHDTRSRGLRQDAPEILVPFLQIPWPSASIAVRTTGDPQAMMKSIAAAVHTVDPEIALATPLTMEQVHDEVMASDRFTALLFSSFAGVALVLAAIGIYGVMAFSVAQRSHEIAVRMALGSSRNRVIGLVVKEGVLLAFIGLAVGLIGAYLVGRAMQSMLFGVGAMDFSAFGIVGCILLTAALLACYLPARRAASVNPMDALRGE